MTQFTSNNIKWFMLKQIWKSIPPLQIYFSKSDSCRYSNNKTFYTPKVTLQKFHKVSRKVESIITCCSRRAPFWEGALLILQYTKFYLRHESYSAKSLNFLFKIKKYFNGINLGLFQPSKCNKSFQVRFFASSISRKISSKIHKVDSKTQLKNLRAKMLFFQQ